MSTGSTISATASATSSSAATTTTNVLGSAQNLSGQSLTTLFTSIAVSAILFGVQILAFFILKDRLARIYKPKTYLVPERQRTEPPPKNPLKLLPELFTFRDREVINKCGLDAYFFLRYLQTLLIIFIPMACVVLPIIVPLNYVGGRGSKWGNTHGNTTGNVNVSGMDEYAWANIKPENTNRYWVHLTFALLVIIWVCGVFFAELRVFVKVRQDYLTSAEHRLRASATTVLVSAIPDKWLTTEALAGLYDVFPGGIRNIIINRDLHELLDKIKLRDNVFAQLEGGETALIRSATKAHKKQLEKDQKAAKQGTKKPKLSKEEKKEAARKENAEAESRAASGGLADPNNVPHTIDEALQEEMDIEGRQKAKDGKTAPAGPGGPAGLKFKLPGFGSSLAAVGQGFGAVGQGFEAVGQGIGRGTGVMFNAAGKVVRDTGDNVVLGAKIFNDQLVVSNGFADLDETSSLNEEDQFDQFGRFRESGATPAAPYGAGTGNDNIEPPPRDDEREDSSEHGSARNSNAEENVALEDRMANSNHERNGSGDQRNRSNHQRSGSNRSNFQRNGSNHQRNGSNGLGPYSLDEARHGSLDRQALPGNTVRQGSFQYGTNGATESTENNWWKFWRGPAGGFPSPIPNGYEEGDEFPLMADKEGPDCALKKQEPKKNVWSNVKRVIPFLADDSAVPVEYPLAHNPDYVEVEESAVWHKYLKAKDRPTHRIPLPWMPGFLSWLRVFPFLGKKVDTIYWCRGELSRLNLEIKTDQEHPERFPMMNSAFIQFNHQVAAHMACQAVTYHIPKYMAPRTVEISPDDVIWANMSIKWWEAWIRTVVVFAIVIGLVVLWAFPVAWTSTLSQLNGLGNKYSWLHWLLDINQTVLKALQGVLPALVLTLLLLLVPWVMGKLAIYQGVKTGSDQKRLIQMFYFAFLFVQVFLVVSLSSTALATFTQITSVNITSIPETLGQQLPQAANYFFSYMILQSFGTSSGTLLQLQTLVLWYIMPLFDSTARQKWSRNTNLPTVSWGSFFPVYTNFACITLVYCIVSPIILIFAIITFTLLYIANRYNMLYVTVFRTDTGGLLYPSAINQTFTGLYIMEVCLIGLFFVTKNADGDALTNQAIIMLVALVLTAVYQILLNVSFGPLLRNLPITFEDEAVLRDEAFEKAQARRLGIEGQDDDPASQEAVGLVSGNDIIEMSNLHSAKPPPASKLANLNPVRAVSSAGNWASRQVRTWNGHGSENAADRLARPPHLRIHKRHKDIEAQQKISNALYGGYDDDVEDLTKDERDVFVRHAFLHQALRSRPPTVWIPRDKIGVSDDEVRRTREFAQGNISISNVGAALDGKSKVVYGRNPPDFSAIDLIQL